jgi:hypothetical protein
VTWLGKGTAAAETDSTKCERRWRAVLSLDSPNMPIELGKRKWRCCFYYDEFCLSLSLSFMLFILVVVVLLFSHLNSRSFSRPFLSLSLFVNPSVRFLYLEAELAVSWRAFIHRPTE